MEASPDDSIEVVRDLAAAPADVFEAWTTAERFARWFGGPAVAVPLDDLDYAPVAGGTWAATMVLPDGARIEWVGEVLEVVPPERLVLTMTDEPASEARARLVVELAPVGGGTRMVFRQQTPGFTAEQRAATAAGWGTFFDELEAGLPPASR